MAAARVCLQKWLLLQPFEVCLLKHELTEASVSVFALVFSRLPRINLFFFVSYETCGQRSSKCLLCHVIIQFMRMPGMWVGKC